MDINDRGYAQPFDFVNTAALSVALEDVAPELLLLMQFLGEAADEETQTEAVRESLNNLTVRSALSLLERAASGRLALREQPTLLKYLVNANMLLRQQYQGENVLAELLFELERTLIMKMALSFPTL